MSEPSVFQKIKELRKQLDTAPMVNTKSREQKLIDIMFEVAQRSAIDWTGRQTRKADKYYKVREDHMLWVAQQLRSCGFDTVQVGASWGVLKKHPDLEPQQSDHTTPYLML